MDESTLIQLRDEERKARERYERLSLATGDSAVIEAARLLHEQALTDLHEFEDGIVQRQADARR
jgi:hypothetical protein